MYSFCKYSRTSGISVPCGVDNEGMPIGMQLIGNKFCEETILNAAYTFEQKK